MTKPSPTSRYWPQNAGDSPRAALPDDSKLLVASTSSSKKCGKRGMQKRVVAIPIKDIEGMKLKDDQMISSPPSDSWTWRKYGQKPIKGSPYPRGYYRCSSSKGCPAKKQVERSKTDPKLLLITYSHEHNHPFPIPSSRNHRTTATTTTTSISEEDEEEEEEIEQQVEEEAEEAKKPLEVVPEYKFPNINDEFGWISEFESTSCMMLESPILADDQIANDEMAMIFTMREEDEPLFADLGELPECSTVFRRATAARGGNHQLINQITM